MDRNGKDPSPYNGDSDSAAHRRGIGANERRPSAAEERDARADEREAALDAREDRAESRDAEQSDREDHVDSILDGADVRDDHADARDAATSLHSFLHDEEFAAALKARRFAALDRLDSKSDRASSGTDRSDLTDPAQAGPGAKSDSGGLGSPGLASHHHRACTTPGHETAAR